MVAEQFTLFADNPEYDAFVEKFKPKKTTDDCYTPPLVYETVKNWVCEKYGIAQENIVRPFWPGGDYESFDYPEGAVVLDNPPFSILSKICKFYLDREIPFFLFAPSLTALCGRSVVMRINHVICDANIVYENGANVCTSFVTSFGGDTVIQSEPELTRRINLAVAEIRRETVKNLPKYTYPDNIVTAPMVRRYSKYGIDFSVRCGECRFISELDAQKRSGKGIYGGGLLVNNQKAAERAAAERASAERAAAERATAIQWRLSDRERAMVEAMSGEDERT